MTPTHLHTYQCSMCKTVATFTMRGPEVRIDCVLCHRWMRHLFAEPITTDAQRALAARGLVFSPHTQTRTRHCDSCRKQVERSGMIYLPGVGYFCETACADAGVAKHEAYMLRLQAERDEQKRREQPWLHKESA